MKTQLSTLLGGILLLASIGAASAADLGPYKPYNPPPPEREADYRSPAIWEGAYVGVNGGYGWSHSALSEPEGAFGGAQIGYNWQRDRLVFGVEGDFQGSDINKDQFGAFSAARTDVDWFSTVRGRVGIANGPFLLYGTGGVAFADIENVLVTPGPTLRDSGTQTGYVVGGGLEWAFAPQWSMKAEYLYLGFGDDTISGGGATARVNNDFQTVRVGLNYKF